MQRRRFLAPKVWVRTIKNYSHLPISFARASSSSSPFDAEFLSPRHGANYSALTPTVWLGRSAQVNPNQTMVVYNSIRRTYQQTHQRCLALAAAFQELLKTSPETSPFKQCIATLLPNVPAMLEAHFAVPYAGAVLNPINTRQDASTISFILSHSEAKILLLDWEFKELALSAFDMLPQGQARPLVIVVTDKYADNSDRSKLPEGWMDYEDLVASSSYQNFSPVTVKDEWDAISLNYTSGTTGRPKGVVVHHRGAYLSALGNIIAFNRGLTARSVYLWTLPMFHCNGWCFPWAITSLSGTHVCLRKVETAAIWNAIEKERVTHLCGAPIVVRMLTQAEDKKPTQSLQMMTAAAPPPEATLRAAQERGIEITHVYGLTEVYGPATVCEWDPDWNQYELHEQAALRARQGVAYPTLCKLQVLDGAKEVPEDGKSVGEVVFSGNMVFKGYFKSKEATEEAFKDNVGFWSGDLGVRHPGGYIQLKDRSKDIIIAVTVSIYCFTFSLKTALKTSSLLLLYIQLKDRSKDIIISGGENISSIEIEDVLFNHEDVLDVAVVARPDDKWGETPCAFVTPKRKQDRRQDPPSLPRATSRDSDTHPPSESLEQASSPPPLSSAGEYTDKELQDLEQSLKAHCKKYLAGFKMPKTFVFADLPKTSTGKIQKHLLRAQAKKLAK
eukprot:g72687.t1